MKVSIKNEQTKNKILEYEENFWTGKKTITYDGKILTKIKRNLYELKTDVNAEKIEVKGNQLIGVTILMFNNQIEICRKLFWHEILLGIIVFIPCVLFGAIGGAIGGALGFTNLTIIKNIDKVLWKIVISVEFAIVSVLLSYLFAVIIFKVFTLI